MWPSQVLDPGLEDACGEDPNAICEWVYDQTGNETLARLADWLVGRPLAIGAIVLTGWIVSRLLHRSIRRWGKHALVTLAERTRSTGTATVDEAALATERIDARAHTISTVLAGLASTIVWTVVVFLVLDELEVNLAPLLATAGVAAAALGFGAQSMVKDFLAGIFMVMEDQFGVGDVIDVGEATGVVERFTLRSTRLRSVDGTVWHVPNGVVLRVGNKSQQWSRALLDVSVAYGTDVTRARDVILRTARELCEEPEWAGIVLEPPEVWGVEMLGADGISVRLVVKTLPGQQWGLMRALRERLKEVFDAEGIEIPFPQRTLWVRSEGGTAAPGGTSPG